MHIYNDEYSSIKNDLVKKTEECEIAAKLGQMLLEENTQLKERNEELLRQVETGETVIQDALLMEIQNSLLEQSRKLSVKLQEEQELKIELEGLLESSSRRAENLQSKNQILMEKNNILINRQWELQQRITELELERSEEMTLSAHHTEDEPSIGAEYLNEYVESPVPQYAIINTKDEKRNRTSDVRAQLSLPCGQCEQFTETIESLENEKNELKIMLERAQDSLLAISEESKKEPKVYPEEHVSFSFGSEFDDCFDSDARKVLDVGNSNDSYLDGESNPLASSLRVSESSSISKNTSKAQPVEALTFTMIGSWFQKYNRYNKNPKLRFCWINPYERTLNWTNQPPSALQTNLKKTFISSFQWRDAPLSRNYPPSSLNCLSLSSGERMINLQPMSWEIHDKWIRGITFLLKKTRTKLPVHMQFQLVEGYRKQEDEDEESESAINSPMKGTQRRQRIQTSFTSHEPDEPAKTPLQRLLSTPRKLSRMLSVHKPL